MLGFVNLNKPAGLTSHDCVAKIRRLLKLKRVGHGGTLDPAAMGVLPIAVGSGTRLLSYLPQQKAYRAKIRFGIKTTTDDLEGEIIENKTAGQLKGAEISALIAQFQGQIEQIPPQYSAIQRGGKRLYELARSGEKVEVPARIVKINQIEILDFRAGEYPELDLSITCGPGTYIRAIARDLGDILGVGGTLAALTRTLSCGFELSESLTFQEVQTQLERGEFSLISADFALKYLRAITLTANESRRWCHGQRLSLKERTHLKSDKDPEAIRVINSEGIFLGMGQIIQTETGLVLLPKIVLTPL